MSADKKVLLIATSASVFNHSPSGAWLEELAAPYYKFKAAGIAVQFASPAGGPIPIDQGSMGEGFFTDACKKAMHDEEFVGALSHSLKLADADLAAYGGCYLAGGHGTCTDFVDNAVLKNVIETYYNGGKLVAADCHGPIALAQCSKADGTPLVKGLNVTGFSDSEEDAVGQTANVPFLIEAKFKEQGGTYTSGADWSSHAVVHDNLVTGQNPQSSDACADAAIAIMIK